jgi:glycosyltransferase involved in cell wall biosynthesis
MLKKLDLSIIIPTKDRPSLIKKTIDQLSKNIFFFKEIIIIDSSNKFIKKKIYNIISKSKLNIKIYDSKPSISVQRNLGLKKVKKNRKLIMFLDDDINFYKDSLKKMYKFINNNSQCGYDGIGFNLINKEKENFLLTLIKKSYIFTFLDIYNSKPGIVTKSGWHTKATNLKSNTFVDWLTTQAVIYVKKKIQKKNFEILYGKYSYLEDLDFSFSIKNRNNLIICSNAKYYSNNKIKRNSFNFGFKEIFNRYIFIKKFNLSTTRFFVNAILLGIKNMLVSFLSFKKEFYLQSLGNLASILYIISFNNKISNKINLYYRKLFFIFKIFF